MNHLKTLILKEKSKRRDWITLCSAITALVITLAVFLIPKVYAADDTAYTDAEAKKVGKGNIEMAMTICGLNNNAIVNTLRGEGTYSPLYEYCSGIDLHESERKTEIVAANHILLYNNFKHFIDSLKWIAGGWVVVIAAAGLIKGLDAGRDGEELALKFFFEICTTMVIIINLESIVTLGCSVIHNLNMKLTEIEPSLVGTDSSETGWKVLIEQIHGKSINKFTFIDQILLKIELLIPWVMAWVLNMASLFVLIQTIMEVGIRRVFLSLAVADVYNEGLRSPGVRYIKKLLGALLKFGICILASKFANLIGVTGNGMEYCFNMIVANLVAVGIMFKGGEYTNDILGV